MRRTNAATHARDAADILLVSMTDKPKGPEDEGPSPPPRTAPTVRFFEPPPPSSGENFTRTIVEQPAYQAPGGKKEPYLTMIAGAHAGSVVKISERETILGRAPECTLRVDGDGVSWKHARIFMIGDHWFVEDLKSTNGTALNDRRIAMEKISDGDRVHLGPGVILRFSLWDELEASVQQGLYESAVKDPLTGAYNRKHFAERLAAEVGYAARHHAPLCLIMFDVDHFKRVNDTHGHPAGDQVLRSIAAAILGIVRVDDVFARVGGEEFALLARATDAQNAVLFAERLRQGIEGMPVAWGGGALQVTASFGVSSLQELASPSGDALVAIADGRLYEAKRSGRNRVVGPK
jgi:diguanylate cyclase (GGDEF)-like protein